MEDWALHLYLEHSDPNTVFDWLKTNRHQRGKPWPYDREAMEEALLQRGEPLIDLGLALYGTNGDVCRHIYDQGNSSIQRAVLAGIAIPFREMKEWLADNFTALTEEWDEHKLSALVHNPMLDDDVLVALFERKPPFDSLSDDKWTHLMAQGTLNERLSRPYNETWMDGWAEHSYGRVSNAAWKLFETLPVTYKTTRILCDLGDRVVCEEPHDMDLHEVLARWNPETGDQKEQEAYAEMRTTLACLIRPYGSDFRALENHEDPALRCAFYRSTQQSTAEQVAAWAERDGEDFLRYALYNENLYMNPETRAALRQACWDAPDPHSRMDIPNYFKMQSEALEQKHPEWFEGEHSEEIPFESITEFQPRIEKRVQHIDKQLTQVRNLIREEDDEDKEDIMFSIIDSINAELAAISSRLTNISERQGSGTPWLLAGLAAGFVIAKYIA